MSLSQTYGVMQNQIADELQRSDLLTPMAGSNLTLSPIQNAIQGAITRWERERFYFNELNDTNGFSTSSGQEFYGPSTAPVSYALIGTIAHIDKLHVIISNNRYTLTERTWQYLEDTSVNPSVVGQPIDFAYYASQLRFYPIPDAAYPMTMSGTKRLSALVATGDANAWTQDAFDLIRSQAKYILATEGAIPDPDLAVAAHKAIYGDPEDRQSRGYLYDLKAETTRRGAGTTVRPTYF